MNRRNKAILIAFCTLVVAAPMFASTPMLNLECEFGTPSSIALYEWNGNFMLITRDSRQLFQMAWVSFPNKATTVNLLTLVNESKFWRLPYSEKIDPRYLPSDCDEIILKANIAGKSHAVKRWFGDRSLIESIATQLFRLADRVHEYECS